MRERFMTIRTIGRSVVAALFLSASPMLAWGAELAVVGTGDGIEVLKALSGAFNKTESAVEVTIGVRWMRPCRCWAARRMSSSVGIPLTLTG